MVQPCAIAIFQPTHKQNDLHLFLLQIEKKSLIKSDGFVNRVWFGCVALHPEDPRCCSTAPRPTAGRGLGCKREWGLTADMQLLSLSDTEALCSQKDKYLCFEGQLCLWWIKGSINLLVCPMKKTVFHAAVASITFARSTWRSMVCSCALQSLALSWIFCLFSFLRMLIFPCAQDEY